MKKVAQSISVNPPSPGSPLPLHAFPYFRFSFAASFMPSQAARGVMSARALPLRLELLAETQTLSSGEAF